MGSKNWQKSGFSLCNSMTSTLNVSLLYYSLKNKANIAKLLTPLSNIMGNLMETCKLFIYRLDFKTNFVSGQNIFTPHPARAEHNTRSIFKGSLTGLNSEFSFF